MDPRSSRVRRATLSLGSACSNACIFCGQRGLATSAPSGEALGALRETSSGITFGGGEPTLTPGALLEAVSSARALGFTSIGVQTNGHALAEHARALAGAGLTDVHVSLHGASAPVHDYHTGRAGSFDVLWEGVAASRAAGLRVVATTVLTRSDFRVLSELPILLQARGVAAWHVAVPLARGAASDDFDRVYPRLALALPFALHALEVARRLALPAYVSGAPLCLLGPLASRAIAVPEPEGARTFHDERCTGCAARAACPGLDPTYLARWGGDELRPRDDRPSGADHEPLAALFTGPGALAPPRDRPVHEPPQSARRALPMYGRPRRAVNEAATRAAKSGEALREILPALFERGDEREDA